MRQLSNNLQVLITRNNYISHFVQFLDQMCVSLSDVEYRDINYIVT